MHSSEYSICFCNRVLTMQNRASRLPTYMRKKSILIAIVMVSSSLAGCASEDVTPPSSSAEWHSPVGEWWSVGIMAMEIRENGTLIDSEGNSGTWVGMENSSIINMTITFHESKEIWTIAEGATFTYAVEGDWLWLRQVSHDCHKLSSESISEDEWNASAGDRPPNSFC